MQRVTLINAHRQYKICGYTAQAFNFFYGAALYTAMTHDQKLKLAK